MLEAALSAVQNLFGCPCAFDIFPLRLVFLLFGVLMGLSLGAMPGLGGLVGLAILLPFTFEMDPFMAFALMIGLLSVTSTSDTIPSVLFAVPGTVASQATIMDGHPMAKKGEAGRAFGAAYTASMLGGIFGGLVLAVLIPVLRPMVLAFGSAEFFMLGVLGISMVAILSGRAPIKGLIAGAIGLLVGMVGMDPQTGVMRWVFGQIYLWDGVPLVPVALGIFAIPEIVDLFIKGTRIADVPKDALKSVGTGIRDSLRHWFLVIRCSAIGVLVGFIPGLGAPVVDWFAYGHAAQTEKGARESFGKGDVRGVIAPESANNAKEAGALIPTIAFGVPGSASMALVLGAFLIQGLTPGPDMLTKHLDVTYTIVWSLVIANIFGTAICLLLTNQLAKLALIRIHFLVPPVIVIIFLAAFQASRSLGDLLSLLLFSALGWLMKRFAWPRPPLILGLVLSGILERNLYISVAALGMSWLTRPIVILVGILAIASLVYGLWQPRRRIGQKASLQLKIRPGVIFTLVIAVVLFALVVTARDWPLTARLFPWAIGIPALGFCLIQIVMELLRAERFVSAGEMNGFMDLPVDRDIPASMVTRRAAIIFGWLVALFAAIKLVGFLISVPTFVWLYLTIHAKERWWFSLVYTTGTVVFVLSVFHYLLAIPWPRGALSSPEKVILQWLSSY